MIQVMFLGGYELLIDSDWESVEKHFCFVGLPGPRWVRFNQMVIYFDKVLWVKEVK